LGVEQEPEAKNVAHQSRNKTLFGSEFSTIISVQALNVFFFFIISAFSSILTEKIRHYFN